MNAQTVLPKEAHALFQSGAALGIDVRTVSEVKGEFIAGSVFLPQDIFSEQRLSALLEEGQDVILICRSDNRATQLAERFAGQLPKLKVLKGGIVAWKKDGLPTSAGCASGIPMERQVLISAGSLVLLGLLLSKAIAPEFIGVSAFVGAGLIFAGVTGFCGMAKILAKMPWNTKNNSCSLSR